MLCKMLAAAKVAGDPGSLFHNPSLEAWVEYYDLIDRSFLSRREMLDAVFLSAKARGRGSTDIFGLRMQRGSFDYFMEQLALKHPEIEGDMNRIQAEFGRTLFIHLSREDRLDQAISRLRAEQTGLWHVNADGTDLERQAPLQSKGYDAAAIRAHMAELSELDLAWKRWFDSQSIEPLAITYEALSGNPQRILGEVLTALGLDGSLVGNIPPQTKKLADGTNLAWRERFEAETDID